MGFPLDRGSIEDGIPTCHWHHARFELVSGCTFDLCADDAPTCPVEIRAGGEIWVKPVFGYTDPVEHWRRRLSDGLAHNLSLVIAKAVHGATPRRERAPLASRIELATLKRWLRRWVAVPHREAAERIVLTAIAGGASPAELADLLFAAETDRVYADGGHSLDFINKAFECLDLIGWEYAAEVLPTIVGQMTEARGAEESTAWRQPIDLNTLCQGAVRELFGLVAVGRGASRWSDHANLADGLLSKEPPGIIDQLKSAARAGASPADLGKALAYAAALRVARFGTANEHADWETAHHVFTYTNALHQALKRIESGGKRERSCGSSARPAARHHDAPSRALSERAAGGIARRGRQ